MSKPKFAVGDKVLVYCSCGCTNYGKGTVTECHPFNNGGVMGQIASLVGRKLPPYIYRVDCVTDEPGVVPEHWLHPIPPTEPAMDTLKGQIDEWVREHEAEPA